MEKVSVVLPVYNGAECLSNAIQSVLSQTYSNLELIIIDDGSNDDSVAIVQDFMKKDNRVRLLVNSENKGVSFSRNKGLDNSTGDFIAFIDADDEWYFNKLEVQMDYIRQNKVNWVFSNYKFISEKESYLVKREKGKYSYKDMISNGNPIGMLTCLIRKDIIGDVRFVNEHHEDYIFWLDIAKKNHCAYNTGDILAIYSAVFEGISSNKIKSFFWTFKVYLRECQRLGSAIKLQLNYVKNYFSRKNKE